MAFFLNELVDVLGVLMDIEKVCGCVCVCTCCSVVLVRRGGGSGVVVLGALSRD
jgi:hypothetical protein